MNNTQHTPGPWVAEESDGNLAKVSYTGTGLRSVIARLHENSLCNEHTGSVNANAHLIAAAPAMYEALVETMKVLRSLRDNKEEWYTLVTPELLTAWDKNKAALAQAEGRDK